MFPKKHCGSNENTLKVQAFQARPAGAYLVFDLPPLSSSAEDIGASGGGPVKIIPRLRTCSILESETRCSLSSDVDHPGMRDHASVQVINQHLRTHFKPL